MKRLLILVLMTFMIGFITSGLVSNIDSNLEFPTGISSAKEVISPSNHITNDQIHVYDSRILLDVKDAEWSIFSNTNSMDPVLDEDSNGLEIKPTNPEQISVGDIISYKSSVVNGLIVHRVIETGEDGNGWYAIAKGDNNPSEDPERIRFNQVQGIVIAILY